jgi:hypothetical protein
VFSLSIAAGHLTHFDVQKSIIRSGRANVDEDDFSTEEEIVWMTLQRLIVESFAWTSSTDFPLEKDNALIGIGGRSQPIRDTDIWYN